MFNTNANIFSSEQLPPNNCVFEEKNLKNTQNSFVPKTFQATKFNLHKVYIHIFTEECSHTGMEETLNLKIHFIFEVFKKSG